MNELASLGLILLLALLAGHLVQFLRIPEVTGYLLAVVMRVMLDPRCWVG